jgi:hypothetical protein
MGQIALTITPSGAGIADGERIISALWSAGIDHAALVTAGVSRADGYDLRLIDTGTGSPVPHDVSGLNTSNLRISWTFAGYGDLAPPDTNTAFALRYGDLGWRRDPTGGVTGSDAANASISAGAVPGLTMPAPKIQAEVAYLRADDSAEGLSPRHAVRHYVDRSRCVFQFEHLSPEDWYQLRAWRAARQGRIPASEIPDPQAAGSSPYFVIESAQFSQSTKRGYTASLTLLGVPL